jgi:hypothetical protein
MPEEVRDPGPDSRRCRDLSRVRPGVRLAPIARIRTRMRHRWTAFLVALAAVSLAAPALAQDAAAKTDSDPTRPVLFSLRPEFYRVDDGLWRGQVIARYDQAMARNRRWAGGKRGMLLRFELPVAAADTPSTSSSGGLGDAYAQLLLVPKLSGRFALVAGTGLVMPSATSDILGGGKWTLAPAVLPVWFLRGVGLAYVKVQDFISIAGDDDRADTHFMLITPTFIRSFGRSSWILLDSETKTDWRRDARTGVKSGVQWGRIVGRGVGLWVKPEVWWGANRDGQWNLKTGIVWYRGGGGS